MIEPLSRGAEVERTRSRRSTWHEVTVVATMIAIGTATAVLRSSAVAADAERAEPQLDALVGRFAAMPGLFARFEEERRISLLRAPLRSEGTLYYAPPDRIARRIDKPAAAIWVARGDELIVGTPEHSRSIDLASAPALRPFVDALRLVLAGDLAELRRHFEIDFDGGQAPDDAWMLRLIPRDGRLRQAVSAIEITGVSEVLSTFRVREADGDETIDRFSQVDSSRRFSEAELARIFDVPAP